MSRKFISLVLAASLTVTGFSALPARASEADDIARILGAAATLFIIGKAIEQQQDRKDVKKKKAKAKAQVIPPAHGARRHDWDNHGAQRRHDDHRPPVVTGRSYPQRQFGRPAPLPAGCLLDVQQGDRSFRVFGKRCLERNYSSARPLPGECQIDVETRRGIRPAYGERCLRRNGYEVAGR